MWKWGDGRRKNILLKTDKRSNNYLSKKERECAKEMIMFIKRKEGKNWKKQNWKQGGKIEKRKWK